MKTHIGKLIEEEVKRQGLSADQFAGMINTSRTNVYHIFGRENIDMELLARISKALSRNFFTEMASEMASMLGISAPPATMANLKLTSLTHPLRNEIEGKSFSAAEYTKDREELKAVLKEYFESDHRIPLLILEAGYTFGAREVVKQMAAEVFHGCGSAPCPKLLDVTKVKVMPERVLVDYIDKNTFDSLEESNRRLNEICQVQKDVTKKIVCIIHTDPIASMPGTNGAISFDQWGDEMGIFLTRYEQCFITVYRWDRRSLLSWAEDTHQHEYVVNYIKKHKVSEDEKLDYQISNAHVSFGQIILGLPLCRESLDYPTAHAYLQSDWEYVSDFLDKKQDISETSVLREFIQDVIDFNENPNKKKKVKTRTIECHIEVNGYLFEAEHVAMPECVIGALTYLYHLAMETDLKGLAQEDVEDQFYPWLKQHHPKVAQAIEEAADIHLGEQLMYDVEGEYRDNIPYYEPRSIDEGWAVDEGVEYNIIFYDLPEWITD
ncbi:MAG: helix-turn-helix transcriptional regulator [Prevotella sp.]|nr:helix-turn-helix transcriptional regulator [Prevotella sp.]